jgi:uncharacterized protein with von Willebrand factor type A (vWA) domain
LTERGVKARLLDFIDCLRDAGLAISPAETLDASRALGLFGVERSEFREVLGATLIKDMADRATFDDEFDRYFATPTGEPGRRKHPRRSGGAERSAIASQESDVARGAKPGEAKQHVKTNRQDRNTSENRHLERRLNRTPRTLEDMPFERMTPEQIEECDLLLRRLAERLQARRRRRLRRARQGRVDLRRTLRRTIATGGVPMLPEFRRRHPGKPDLVALVDLSYSVTEASRFLLSLLSSAPALFRRVRLFGYVDSAVEIWLQDGHLVQDGNLDLYARSDFGKVLRGFHQARSTLLTRNTLLLILGDARNNRQPPRADLLARMSDAVQRVAWLNPEPRERWNSGDSVLRSYAPFCTDLLAAGTPRQLYVALKNLSG